MSRMIDRATRNENRRRVIRTWRGSDLKSFYCPFGDHYCLSCFPDAEISCKGAYLPRCTMDRECECLSDALGSPKEPNDAIPPKN